MPRRSGGGSSRSYSSTRSSSRTRTASPTKTTPTKPAPVPAKSQTSVPANNVSHNASVPTVASSSGPGLVTMIAANAASNAIGYAAGRSLYDAFSGRGGSAVEAPVEQENVPAQQYSNNKSTALNTKGCEEDMQFFMDCLKNSNNDMNACQPFYEAVQQCRARYSTQY